MITEAIATREFTSKGRRYNIDQFGVIHQLDSAHFKYDASYVHTYDTESYRRGSDILQAMRWGFVCGSVRHVPKSLLDYGYGNGAFLIFAQHFTEVYGFDISGVKLSGIRVIPAPDTAEVYTFWDALEHIPDLSFLRYLKCKYICLSLPYCKTWEPEWFDTWKHHKPDEHLHYFDLCSLRSLMNHYGWKMIAHSFHEDYIRQGVDSPNILSAAFARASSVAGEQVY